MLKNLFGDNDCGELLVNLQDANKMAQFNERRDAKTFSAVFAKLKVKYAFAAGVVKGQIIVTDGHGKDPQILATAEDKNIAEVSRKLSCALSGIKLKVL